MLNQIFLQPSEDSDMMEREEGIDSFTLLHHDLNCCTNSLQYAMILDIINNNLLYVQPKKKEVTDKILNMRFGQQLGNVENPRPAILEQQNNLRCVCSLYVLAVYTDTYRRENYGLKVSQIYNYWSCLTTKI